MPHDFRPHLDAQYPEFLTRHLGRAALVLLCISTDLQAFFRFPDANIDARGCDMWKALMNLFEAKELYEEHYEALLQEKGMQRPSTESR